MSELVKLLETQAQATSLPESQVARQVAEVQAAMAIAKRFPRDLEAAWNRILQACRRPSLAAQAIYEFPRGGEMITGPSIRLTEVIAQNYGNVDFGVIELARKDGESLVQAYAWDLETNVRQTRIFSVPHERKAHGKIVPLTDPRDVYEAVASQAARRLRACLLGILPRDFVEAAMEECDKTLKAEAKKEGNLSDRVKKMLEAFAKLGVSPEMIEQRLGHSLKRITERELIRLGRIYLSIRDGFVKMEEVFQQPPEIPAKTTKRTKRSTKKKEQPESPEPTAKVEPAPEPEPEPQPPQVLPAHEEPQQEELL